MNPLNWGGKPGNTDLWFEMGTDFLLTQYSTATKEIIDSIETDNITK